MGGVPQPKLTPLQRAAGHIGTENAQWLFSNYGGKHFDVSNLANVGDEHWGRVLQQTRERVRKNEERAAKRAEREARQAEPDTTVVEEDPEPQTVVTSDPARPIQPPVPNRPERTPENPGGDNVQRSTNTKRRGKDKLRTDTFTTSSNTGTQVPK